MLTNHMMIALTLAGLLIIGQLRMRRQLTEYRDLVRRQAKTIATYGDLSGGAAAEITRLRVQNAALARRRKTDESQRMHGLWNESVAEVADPGRRIWVN